MPRNPMKNYARVVLIFAILLASVHTQAQEKKRLSFDQIFKNGAPKLTEPLPTISGWKDDDHYLETKKKEGDERSRVYAVDVKSGKEEVYRDLEQYRNLVDSTINLNFPASHNESYDILIYESAGDLYLLDTKKREFKRLTATPAEEKNPTLSPNAEYVAFTRDNNLFSIDLASGKETQYTNDGTDVIYSGWAAWVYYEEIFGRPSHYRAFWWSPDSKRLGFYRFDETNVPMFPIYNAEGVHGSLEKTRYPEAGDPNPAVRIGIVAVGGGQTTWADFNEKADQYFGSPFWTPDGKEFLVQWMNRQQDTLIIYGVDPASGAKRQVYLEHQPSWVEWFESIEFVGDDAFIIRSDKDGWSHLYLYGMDGQLRQRITEGKWAVTDLLLVDRDNSRVYFTAHKEASTSTDLYRIGLDGKGLTRLTFGDYTHSVKVSPKGKYFISTYSNITTPPRMGIYDNRGKLIRNLGDSKTKEYDKYMIAKSELFRVRTSDGYELPVSWTLPLGFDQHKKYPVIISIYGGPASPTVSNSWTGLGGQWLAMEGAIRASVDHRASGHFGKEGVALMHRCLGKWEMNDYIEFVKWLRTKPFVDSTRICITGGSYGGYVTCLALTKGADYFTHGVADFSVTDWKLYDSHYTERYMDTPEENPEGYKDGSVLSYVKNYKGHLMIVHGTMDDNVHMQNSIQFINALEDLGKHFEFLLYPGERHGWGGPKATHLRNETYRFYYRYLLGKEFPEDLFAK